jgi:hypothetical protein
VTRVAEPSRARRAFLCAAGGLTAGRLLGMAHGESATAGPPARGISRAEEAYRVRESAARAHRYGGVLRHATNGDEERHPDGVASFTKGLPHDFRGRVSPSALAQLRQALRSGRREDFEKIRLGKVKKLVNPQAALAYALEGADPHQFTVPPPPAFEGEDTAAEMAELYWQALVRDVRFDAYGEHPLTAAAAAELSALRGFRGPRQDGSVTAGTLFRGGTAGDLAGPYLSQFLWKDVPYGATLVAQRIRTAVPGVDYAFTFARWLALQNGDVAGRNLWIPVPRYICTGRDLSEYVHRDFTYQAFLNACLILLFTTGQPGMLDWGNPYALSENQAGFCTFGEAHVLDLVARVANEALKATWHQKWLVHRRLRPEEFGGRVHLQRSGRGQYSIHADVLGASVLDRVAQARGGFLLPQAYPEGCPLHPAYPAGHAAIAGACATVLKAFFEEAMVLPDPVVPTADGLGLDRYAGGELTVGGELDKLAFNIAMGRNFAGIHWRSDAATGLALGEAVAQAVLADMAGCFNEGPGHLSFTAFDGRLVTLS